MDATIYFNRSLGNKTGQALILRLLAGLAKLLGAKRSADDPAALRYIASKYPGAYD